MKSRPSDHQSIKNSSGIPLKDLKLSHNNDCFRDVQVQLVMEDNLVNLGLSGSYVGIKVKTTCKKKQTTAVVHYVIGEINITF